MGRDHVLGCSAVLLLESTGAVLARRIGFNYALLTPASLREAIVDPVARLTVASASLRYAELETVSG